MVAYIAYGLKILGQINELKCCQAIRCFKVEITIKIESRSTVPSSCHVTGPDIGEIGGYISFGFWLKSYALGFANSCVGNSSRKVKSDNPRCLGNQI